MFLFFRNDLFVFEPQNQSKSKLLVVKQSNYLKERMNLSLVKIGY